MHPKELWELVSVQKKAFATFSKKIKKNNKYYLKFIISLRQAKRCRRRIRDFYHPSSQFAMSEYKRHVTNFLMFLAYNDSGNV
jgi:hypothetical protein